MSRNNDVFQVLVTKGNQAVLAVGKRVADLAPGQIGVFDFNTGLSITAAEAATTRDYYLAVGIDADGDGVTDEITKSAGSHIQNRNLQFYNEKPYSAGKPMKVLLSGYTADCETEYGLKLELRNQEIYRSQGYNQFTKTYSIVTGCCNGCTPTCPSGDANEITKLLKININNDPSGLIIADAVARTAIVADTVEGITGAVAIGAVLTDEQVDLIMVHNSTLTDVADFIYTDLEITTITQKIQDFCSVNLMYFYPRQTVVIATKIEGFKCNGKVATSQQVAFEEGAGYDIKQLEYIAKGWTESPYRVSSLNGVANYTTYNASATEKYTQIALTYDQFSIGAWLEYYNNLATIIAIPQADTVTRNALVAILSALLKKEDIPVGA